MRSDALFVQSGGDTLNQRACATEKPEAPFHFEQQLTRGLDAD
jgi:hypothetical protein